MKKTLNTIKKNAPREIDYVKILEILLSRWYLLAGTILVTISIAYAYLWYSPKTYVATGILKLEEKKSEWSDLAQVMHSPGRPQANLQGEKFILQSKNLIRNAINRLDYPVSFYTSGRFRTYDLYPAVPVQVSLLKSESPGIFQELITFKPIDRHSFSLSWNTTGREIQKTFMYDTPVYLENLSFSIKYPGPIDSNTAYQFKFNSPEQLLNRVIQGLKISEVTKNANIINLQQTDFNPQFAADILNALMTEYLDYDQQQKTKSATMMIHFINEQQAYLSAAVKGSESSLEKFKQNSGIMNIEAAANHTLTQLGELKSQQSLFTIQLMAIDQLKKQLMAESDSVNINFNMEGSVDPLLSTLIASLNQLLSNKSTLLKTYNQSSATITALNLQIAEIKAAALQNISASDQRIRKNISYFRSQIAQIEKEASVLPAAEKDMISLSRDFVINEKVYSFLSQKKLEAQINKSAILPGATIIEKAQSDPSPVSPKVAKVYRTAVLLGLLAGLAIIILTRLLNPYIYDIQTVENTTNIPILGIIRKFPNKIDANNTQILSLAMPRSIFAESVRAVRTKLNFLATEEKSKIICVTSECAGEGKSFVALNLSSSLAMINKKIILIGADLRIPKLHKAFESENNIGLSNFLVGQCSLNEIIQHTNISNLDFISSGPVPPNPAELLHNERLNVLLKELKEQYEIVMIDTAPLGLVSDSIPLICKSDIILFVIRYGKSRYSARTIPEQLAQEYGLKNMAIVLNAFVANPLQSSYYKNDSPTGASHCYADYKEHENSGYFENEERRKWWKRKR